MARIVITGATGFVGINLSAYLARKGHTVIPVSLRDADWKTKFTQDARAVIHLAGLAHDLKNNRNEAEYFRVNTVLTRHVFDTFVKTRATKFVFLSSVKAVTDSPGQSLVDEARAPNPATAYGKSKLEAEQYLLSRSLPGKAVYVLRPCMIHGPGNKGNLNFLYRLISRGIPYPLAAFENSRSFLSVDNLSFVVAAFCERDIPPGIYNVADDETLSTTDVVGIINSVTGKPSRNWRLPRGLMIRLAALTGALGLPFNADRLKKLTESYRVDNGKMVSALGSRFPLTARQGLRRTIESFR